MHFVSTLNSPPSAWETVRGSQLISPFSETRALLLGLYNKQHLISNPEGKLSIKQPRVRNQRSVANLNTLISVIINVRTSTSHLDK